MLQLSPFATMWNALFGWLTCSSLALIYGRDEASMDEFMEVNGREYPRKAVLKDGRSAEIKQTMAACIARALSQLATDLCLRVPVSLIEKAMVISLALTLLSNLMLSLSLSFPLLFLRIFLSPLSLTH